MFLSSEIALGVLEGWEAHGGWVFGDRHNVETLWSAGDMLVALRVVKSLSGECLRGEKEPGREKLQNGK